MSLIAGSVHEWLAALQSPDPAPGGGSASALTGAMGAALLAMVAGLGKPRASAPDDLQQLSSARHACVAFAEELARLVDADADAYNAVVAAYRLPKATDDDKRSRSDRIQAALTEATLTPLHVMRACAAALEHANVVAAHGNANASSDVLVALELLDAGLRGAKLNVEINLGSLKDLARGAAIREEADRLTAGAASRTAAARAALSGAG